jgi:outer membrane protein assembly factor BamE (lipoprotein component of BamABCDE complex)
LKTLNHASALCAALCIALAGCSTPSTGSKFDDSYVASIKRGTTTKADIRKNIGEPASITQTSEGEVWTYQYTSGGSYANMVGAAFGLASQQINMQMLTIQFSGDRVKDYTHTVQKPK